jgi:hypothetical protein
MSELVAWCRNRSRSWRLLICELIERRWWSFWWHRLEFFDLPSLVLAVELLGQVVYFSIAHRGTFVSNCVSPTEIAARSISGNQL